MATVVAEILTPELIARVLVLAYAPGVHAVGVVGSVARGDATAWSDVDVHAYVRLSAQKFRTRAAYVGERLVLVQSDTIADARAELSDPAKALWAVPPLRDVRILLDQERLLGALRDEARAFEWAPLAERARAEERDRLVLAVELLHKIRSAIERADESSAAHAAGQLVRRCLRAVVTARGTFIASENEYIRRAQETAGPAWTARYRAAAGLDGGDAFTQARGACLLFCETVRVLDDILDDDARALVARGLEVAP